MNLLTPRTFVSKKQPISNDFDEVFFSASTRKRSLNVSVETKHLNIKPFQSASPIETKTRNDNIQDDVDFNEQMDLDEDKNEDVQDEDIIENSPIQEPDTSKDDSLNFDFNEKR